MCNETVRNCLHKCNRAQVRPSTNEEAEGIETVASLLPGLTEALREGRARHVADITAEGDPEDDEETVVEGGVMDIRLGRSDSQPEPEFNAPATPNAASRRTRSETDAEPEAEVATPIGTDMEIKSSDRRVRFGEDSIDPPRHTLDASTDWESMVEPRGKVPRRPEISEHGMPLRSAEGKSARGKSARGTPDECSCRKRPSN